MRLWKENKDINGNQDLSKKEGEIPAKREIGDETKKLDGKGRDRFRNKNEIPEKKEKNDADAKLENRKADVSDSGQDEKSRRKNFADSLKYDGKINHNIPRAEKKKPSEDVYKEERQLEPGKNAPVKENRKNKDSGELER